MLVTSRRSLILGLTSLVAAPALVKASSLMPLRGYDMDPKVLAFRYGEPSHLEKLMPWCESDYNFSYLRNSWKLKDWISYNSHMEYAVMRKSEVRDNWYRRFNGGDVPVIIEEGVYKASELQTLDL